MAASDGETRGRLRLSLSWEQECVSEGLAVVGQRQTADDFEPALPTAALGCACRIAPCLKRCAVLTWAAIHSIKGMTKVSHAMEMIGGRMPAVPVRGVANHAGIC